jgi:hypothetical protein
VVIEPRQPVLKGVIMAFRKIWIAGILAAATAANPAFAENYTFTILPLRLTSRSFGNLPVVVGDTYSISGGFVGSDMDGDGHIRQNELQYFYTTRSSGGAPQSGLYSDFDYSVETGLSVHGYSPNSFGGTSFSISSSNVIFSVSGRESESTYTSLPNTAIWVDIYSAVPEPANYLMALVGLFGIGGALRRSKVVRPAN